MKNIFLTAIILVYNFQIKMNINQDVLIDFCLLFIQFYLLVLYLSYYNIKKFIQNKIL
jgi:hypothetical protein